MGTQLNRHAEESWLPSLRIGDRKLARETRLEVRFGLKASITSKKLQRTITNLSSMVTMSITLLRLAFSTLAADLSSFLGIITMASSRRFTQQMATMAGWSY